MNCIHISNISIIGKSSLTVRFVEHHFVESYYPTIENTFSRIIKYNGQDYATEIVDTAGQVCPTPLRGVPVSLTHGQDEYSILNSKHFIGIHGYIIAYSVTSRQSFEMVRTIRDKILNHLVSSFPRSIRGYIYSLVKERIWGFGLTAGGKPRERMRYHL